MSRIEAGGRHRPPVLRLEEGERQRVAEQQGQLQLAVVHRRAPREAGWQRVVRIDETETLFILQNQTYIRKHVVNGLAQIDFEILGLPRAVAPDRRSARRSGHRRDGHAGADPKVASHDRVCPDEGGGAAAVAGRSADVLHELLKGLVDIEGRQFRLRCRWRRTDRPRGYSRADRGQTGGLKEFPPGRLDHRTPSVLFKKKLRQFFCPCKPIVWIVNDVSTSARLCSSWKTGNAR